MNNLGLALGMALKFYTTVSKEFKLKVRKFWGLIPTFVEVTWEALVGGSPLCIPLRRNIRLGGNNLFAACCRKIGRKKLLKTINF